MSNNHYQKLTGNILNPKKDGVLSSIVVRATEATGFPVGLVTLILRRTQYFRAHTGLSSDLLEMQSTDRCSSFCQYVVEKKKPLKISDTKKETSLPQLLVNLYGIRAYYGVPVRIGTDVVGSLCVIDTKPHDISESGESAMRVLANEASIRLEELSKESYPIHLSGPHSKNPWEDLASAQLDARMALTELEPVTKAVKMLGEATVTSPKVIQIFQEATESYNDLREAFKKIETITEQIKNSR